MLMSLL